MSQNITSSKYNINKVTSRKKERKKKLFDLFVNRRVEEYNKKNKTPPKIR